MIAPDVNVLIYSFREDAADHRRFKRWLEEARQSGPLLVLFEPVLASVLRLLTNPRIFVEPTPLEAVCEFIQQLMQSPNVMMQRSGERHFELFMELCREARCHGNLVQDAYFAALAIESGCEWNTTDRDFARFPRLRWRNPMADE